MTKIDIAALRELHGKATPGEWTTEEPSYETPNMWLVTDDCTMEHIAKFEAWDDGSDGLERIRDIDRHNIAFIAAAHNVLPALLDRIEELEGEVQHYVRDAAAAKNKLSEYELADGLTQKEPT